VNQLGYFGYNNLLVFQDIDEMVITYPSIKELMYDLKGKE
jgi:hypothetical protein